MAFPISCSSSSQPFFSQCTFSAICHNVVSSLTVIVSSLTVLVPSSSTHHPFPVLSYSKGAFQIIYACNVPTVWICGPVPLWNCKNPHWGALPQWLRTLVLAPRQENRTLPSFPAGCNVKFLNHIRYDENKVNPFLPGLSVICGTACFCRVLQ